MRITEAADPLGRVREYCVIAIDTNDLPHIAYVDRDNGGVIEYAPQKSIVGPF